MGPPQRKRGKRLGAPSPRIEKKEKGKRLDVTEFNRANKKKARLVGAPPAVAQRPRPWPGAGTLWPAHPGRPGARSGPDSRNPNQTGTRTLQKLGVQIPFCVGYKLKPIETQSISSESVPKSALKYTNSSWRKL